MRGSERHCRQRRPTRPGSGWYLQGRAGRAGPFPLTPLAQGWQDLARRRSGRSEQRTASPVSPQGTRPTYLRDSSQAPERTKPKSLLGEGLPSLSGGGGGRSLGVGNLVREERGSLELGVRAWERASERPALRWSSPGGT